MRKLLILGLFFSLFTEGLFAQALDYQNPKNYILSGLEVEGAEYSDANAIISISGLTVGEVIQVPGSQASDAIERLWNERIFSDVNIRVDNVVSNTIFLTIVVKERPRISQFSFQGISKSQADDLREKINFIRGTILTESKRQSAIRIIRNFYVEKGFYNVDVKIEDEEDKILRNGVTVNIKVNKGNRVKIKEIVVEGNEHFTEKKVERKLKKIHEKTWWRFWARSKYVPKTYEEAKNNLIAAYNDDGYRDAIVERDTVFPIDEKHVVLKLKVYEGIQYYHRDIEWSGNYKYNSEVLQAVLNINEGDTYSQSKIDSRLFGDPQGGDVSSLYLDNGYLFFNVMPVEVLVEGDSIDLEMRIQEGPQATVRKVIIQGNTKTSDFVIRRELRTTPGQKFSRSDIIRSQREILALNYFDQEKLGVEPLPNPATGTVDIKYTVEERPADQLQLQGGWGGRIRDPRTGEVIAGGFVGTVQLGFNNFASRRFFKPEAWRPVPSGDGQRLNLAVQMNGVGFQSYSINFMEPWLGGKRPNSLGVSGSYMVFQDRSTAVLSRNNILQTSIDYGRRLKFPDDFFTSRTSIGYKNYNITNPEFRFVGFEGEQSAFINIFTLRQSFDRSSVDAPIYPRSGSTMSLSVEATPPYSLFGEDRDYTDMGDAEKYKWLEYHKWRFNSNWFFRIAGDMVLSTKIEAGYLGAYNSQLGVSPFERFFLGGTGLMGAGFAGLDGRELIPLRGYENNRVTNNANGYPIYNRLLLELRYPISLNQSAPVWVQAFLEAGNGYRNFREYNPFNLRRAAGGGLRVMLPMVGLLGLDWAYGFDSDDVNPGQISGSQFHFIIGQQF
jgi:outer membrane protein insertion porin family